MNNYITRNSNEMNNPHVKKGSCSLDFCTITLKVIPKEN